MQKIVVSAGRLGRLDELRVIAEDYGYAVERSEIAVFVFIGEIEELALRRMIGIDGADLSDRGGLLGRTVGHIEQMISGVHLGLDLDHLMVAGDAVWIHFDEGVAFAEDLNTGAVILTRIGRFGSVT